jgi:hypothetical protein
MYILAGMLVLGLIANSLVRPLAECWFTTDDNAAEGPSHASPGAFAGSGGLDARTALAWTAVALPLAWGAWITLSQALLLFSNRL